MKSPKKQIAEVLHLLLQSDSTSFDIINLGVLNPTAKISALRKLGVVIYCNNIHTKNKFGRSVTYGMFTILNRTEAKRIYNSINK